ncbi:MAG: hypothetical protein ACOC0P_07690, partial [Planctomycetota bacterium]
MTPARFRLLCRIQNSYVLLLADRMSQTRAHRVRSNGFARDRGACCLQIEANSGSPIGDDP